MCNLAFVCELIVFSTVLHGACRDRVDSYHLFALPSILRRSSMNDSVRCKAKVNRDADNFRLRGEDFWFIASSRTISWIWLHSTIQKRSGEVLKILPSSFRAIVNEPSACRIAFHNLRCLMPEDIAGTQKAEYFISLTEAITRTDRDNFGANTKNSFNWAITRATFFSWQLWFMPSICSPHRVSSWKQVFSGHSAAKTRKLC